MSPDALNAADEYDWRWRWVLVLAVNLPLPLLAGFDFTRDGGTEGMYAALALVWLCGHVVAVCVPKLMVAVAWGGMFVAVAQLVLLLHMCVGRLALELVGVENLATSALTNAQAFGATLYTAAILMLVAVAVNGIALALRGIAFCVASAPAAFSYRDTTGACDRPVTQRPWYGS